MDLSENAAHLVRGNRRQIVDWAYQEDPFGLVWAVRKDGALLALQFNRNRELAAWSRHDTEASSAQGAGFYESVCTVPEGEEDAVYCVVTRTQRTPQDAANTRERYIERLTSRVRRVKETDAAPAHVANPTTEDTDTLYPTDVCLDCAFTYRGPPTLEFDGLDRHSHKEVYVVARGSPVMKATVNEDGEIDLTGQLAAVPAANAVDENGNPIWVAHVGLVYECDLETLALPEKLMQKTVSEVAIELDESRGVKCGQSFAKLSTWKQRKVSDAFGVISAVSEVLYTPVTNAWDKTARACVRQTLPLPVTVVGITREIVNERSGE
jgi:hypothetical protein